MIGEGEPLDPAASGPTKFRQATEAVQAAAETVRQTTYSVTEAIEAGRQPGAPLDVLARWTQQAPLQMLAVAFLFGLAFGRRRQ
jgi:hypothetical protein